MNITHRVDARTISLAPEDEVLMAWVESLLDEGNSIPDALKWVEGSFPEGQAPSTGWPILTNYYLHPHNCACALCFSQRVGAFANYGKGTR